MSYPDPICHLFGQNLVCVTINVGHIILGRSWLYDLNVTIFEHLNFYSFVYNEKKVKLVLMQLAPQPDTKQPDASNSKKALI